MEAFVVWFEDLNAGDVARAGGKGANLGELARAGFPVPPGFVVTAQAYLHAMDESGVRDDLREAVASADPDDAVALRDVSEHCQQLVHKGGMPRDLRVPILDAYHQLRGSEGSCGGTLVAVRYSATADDTEGTSFAGMHQTFTDVSGNEILLDRVVDCWASMAGERALTYRACEGITDEPAIAVVVQAMIDSERSGVMFSVDPATGDRSRVVIEAGLGLSEVVVHSPVESDTYVVSKDGPSSSLGSQSESKSATARPRTWSGRSPTARRGSCRRVRPPRACRTAAATRSMLRLDRDSETYAVLDAIGRIIGAARGVVGVEPGHLRALRRGSDRAQ